MLLTSPLSFFHFSSLQSLETKEIQYSLCSSVRILYLSALHYLQPARAMKVTKFKFLSRFTDKNRLLHLASKL